MLLHIAQNNMIWRECTFISTQIHYCKCNKSFNIFRIQLVQYNIEKPGTTKHTDISANKNSAVDALAINKIHLPATHAQKPVALFQIDLIYTDIDQCQVSQQQGNWDTLAMPSIKIKTAIKVVFIRQKNTTKHSKDRKDEKFLQI